MLLFWGLVVMVCPWKLWIVVVKLLRSTPGFRTTSQVSYLEQAKLKRRHSFISMLSLSKISLPSCSWVIWAGLGLTLEIIFLRLISKMFLEVDASDIIKSKVLSLVMVLSEEEGPLPPAHAEVTGSPLGGGEVEPPPPPRGGMLRIATWALLKKPQVISP